MNNISWDNDMACDYSGYCIGADCPMFFTCQVDTDNNKIQEKGGDI